MRWRFGRGPRPAVTGYSTVDHPPSISSIGCSTGPTALSVGQSDRRFQAVRGLAAIRRADLRKENKYDSNQVTLLCMSFVT